MKRILLLLVLMCSEAFAMWALVPLEKLIAESDTIVVATLGGVEGYTKDNVDYGSGVLTIHEVIKGSVKVKTLKLLWQNHSDIACPRVEHKQAENMKLIWLLQTNKEDGTVTANYPGRVLKLSEREKLDPPSIRVEFKPVGPTKG